MGSEHARKKGGTTVVSPEVQCHVITGLPFMTTQSDLPSSDLPPVQQTYEKKKQSLGTLCVYKKVLPHFFVRCHLYNTPIYYYFIFQSSCSPLLLCFSAGSNPLPKPLSIVVSKMSTALATTWMKRRRKLLRTWPMLVSLSLKKPMSHSQSLSAMMTAAATGHHNPHHQLLPPLHARTTKTNYHQLIFIINKGPDLSFKVGVLITCIHLSLYTPNTRTRTHTHTLSHSFSYCICKFISTCIYIVTIIMP